LVSFGKLDLNRPDWRMEIIMKIVNISEAKANLSKLVALVYRGEKVVIAKNNLPLVDLVVHKPEGKRKLGLLAGKFTVPVDIMEEDAEINSMFYGNDS
jgi:antitoxin (DNA-binding transcriptional repressor) of toxin-antitoxin stability system